MRGADLPLAFPLPFPIGRRTIKAQIFGNGKLRDIRSESTLTHIQRTRRGGWKIAVEFIAPATSSCGLFLEWSFVKCTAIAACLYRGSESSSQPGDHNVSLCHVDFEPMAPNAQQQERRDVVVSSLNVAIEVSNLAKEFCSITPAKPVFGSFSVILTMIKVRFFLRCVGWISR